MATPLPTVIMPTTVPVTAAWDPLGNTNPYNHGLPWSVRWANLTDNPDDDWRAGLLSPLHYFTAAVVRHADGTVIIPDYRWNPLHVSWGNNLFPPPVLSSSQAYSLSLSLQNTGIFSFGHHSPTTLSCWWEADTLAVPCPQSVPLPLTLPGQALSTTFSFSIPQTLASGFYTLHFDALADGTFFRTRQPDKPWLSLPYHFCLNYCHSVYLPLLAKQQPLFLETFDPPLSGWRFYTDDLPETVFNYVHLTHLDGVPSPLLS